MSQLPRTIRISADDAHSAGFEIGKALGSAYSMYIQQYAAHRAAASVNYDRAVCISNGTAWIASLPSHFGERFRGLAEGSGTPYGDIVEWAYLEVQLATGCSSVLCQTDGNTWIAHNNDTFVPHLWGYVTVLEVRGRIPTMSFGLAGDIWTTAGANEAQLWMHVDHMGVSDNPGGVLPALPTYAFTVEALETCESISDVNRTLGTIDRTDGMILIAADGKTGEASVFECSCREAREIPLESQWLVRTNHSLLGEPATPRPDRKALDTWSRFDRLEMLLASQYKSGNEPGVADLKAYLADDEVERRNEDFATAYSVVACPAERSIHYTFGGVPSASSGNWQEADWPWL